MPKPERPAVEISDFPGLVLNADPRDLPTGAALEQVNLCSFVVGELSTRLGVREVTFEEE